MCGSVLGEDAMYNTRRPLRGLLWFVLSYHPTNDGGANNKSVVSDDLNTRAYPRPVSENRATTILNKRYIKT